ncbi:Branched-chain alpha-keto acid dehydrogenase E1 component beta subunit [Paramagnetospirillum magnetotacticum MS-1]|uniref:Branched-chain alpha-keto acid dehydrogenase E1 component beta subunit n=1 Tax=Paramagnetospirillum magnetotacticum MS-1 TaxID=272627 RepID=A0A0C2U8C3_PARME|nr:Pyruvate/2-oxoglutarate dehydrogenase complex, dehydrogenase (E1) component, eukaryotic type, subunit beta [Paramagnetospirillum magnetotacticum]KIL97752.1 Branched-chain alpha-keto acid dehydrogenase E1 component beta subunit [Paramagnetospirillum magnetotacticum MS-1]
MNYIGYVNGLIRAKIAATPRLVTYGQNITAGSCLSGLTRGLTCGPDGRIIDTPNVENTLVGAGFGMMLRGINAIYFMKQQDFLLLGLDHLVNTYNLVRRTDPTASFSVVSIIVDSGFEGPQSSLNNFSDFCSMAHLPGYAITNRHDADLVIGRHLVAPGCRLIGVSQRLFGTELLGEDLTASPDRSGDILRYAEGNDATVVAFNFAFPQAQGLWASLGLGGRKSSLFSVPAILPTDWDLILADLARTRRLVIIDDSKSENRSSDRLLLEAYRSLGDIKVSRVCRDFTLDMLSPNPDMLAVEPGRVLAELGLA